MIINRTQLIDFKNIFFLILMLNGLAQADNLPALPKNTVTTDEHWIEQLPLLKIPLPKLSEQTSKLIDSVKNSNSTTTSLSSPLPVQTIEPQPARTENSLHTSVNPPMETDHAQIITSKPSVSEPNAIKLPEKPENIAKNIEIAANNEVPKLNQTLKPSSKPSATIQITELPQESKNSSVTSVNTTSDTAPVVTTGETWQVQLLAGRVRERLDTELRIFQKHYAELLSGVTLTIIEINQDNNNHSYRLRAQEWNNRAAADAWCAKLHARGHACLVVRAHRANH